ncbi:MAG: acyl-CoA thioesterase [Agarilytica sp.]
MISENLTLEVPFFDVDSMNIVWHGHYAKYLELARCKLLEKIGYSYQAMAESGYGFPIIDMHIKYIQPITFGQHIHISATLTEWEYRIKIQYKISDLNSNKKLTTAQTVQAAVNIATKEMRLQCPSVFTEKVEAFQ